MTKTAPSSPSDDLSVIRRRLRFRSWHRGTKETDLLLGPFADAHLADLTAEKLAVYARLLDCPDPDLYAWMIGQAAPEDPEMAALIHFMREFHSST